MKRRVLICGGREYNDSQRLATVMKEIKPYLDQSFCIIQGGARGADRLANMWAFYEGCAVIEMRANWDFYDKAAGHIRNGWMLEFGLPDLVVAFPGGFGTRDMIRQARLKGIDVYEVIS